MLCCPNEIKGQKQSVIPKSKYFVVRINVLLSFFALGVTRYNETNILLISKFISVVEIYSNDEVITVYRKDKRRIHYENYFSFPLFENQIFFLSLLFSSLFQASTSGDPTTRIKPPIVAKNIVIRIIFYGYGTIKTMFMPPDYIRLLKNVNL